MCRPKLVHLFLQTCAPEDLIWIYPSPFRMLVVRMTAMHALFFLQVVSIFDGRSTKSPTLVLMTVCIFPFIWKSFLFLSKNVIRIYDIQTPAVHAWKQVIWFWFFCYICRVFVVTESVLSAAGWDCQTVTRTATHNWTPRHHRWTCFADYKLGTVNLPLEST